MTTKIQYKNILYVILTISTLLAFLKLKQKHTQNNIVKYKRIKLIGFHSILLLFVFCFLLIMNWNKLIIYEKVYLMLFSLIQLLLIKVKKV
ncbi:MAG: hypothetical protein ACI920_003356 [Saprospiraceae bacterium]|jgi:hypothetical protein